MSSLYTADGLHEAGFAGFERVAELRRSECASVPISPGAYVVMRDDARPPEWLATSPAGHFKRRDPSAPAEVLDANWVPGTGVIYIGKADQLRRRLRQYMEFGAGKPVGHWGGRLIWQIKGSDSFRVAWVIDQEPLAREARLIDHFIEEFGAMPFANLRR